VVQVLLDALGEVCRCWAGWYMGWRFNVKLATYLVLLDVVHSAHTPQGSAPQPLPTTSLPVIFVDTKFGENPVPFRQTIQKPK